MITIMGGIRCVDFVLIHCKDGGTLGKLWQWGSFFKDTKRGKQFEAIALLLSQQ